MLGLTTTNCPECNAEVDGEVLVCPYCGFPIKKRPIQEGSIALEVQTQPIAPEKQKKMKLIGAVMCIIGCICLIIAVTRITNDEYKFYLEHYEDCMEGYEDCMNEAKYSSGYFASSYRSIASAYEDMAEDDMKMIWKYRGTAIACCVVGIGLIFIGYKNLKKGGEV